MSTYRYELIVYWSAEGAVFVADIPGLPGCMAHGGTPAEAREDGRAVPEPEGRRLLLA